jgi:hypothetical protein
MKKIYTFRGQKGEKGPPEPKNGIWDPNQYGRVIHPSTGNFTWSKKSLKTELRPQNIKNKVSALKDKNKQAFQEMHATKVFYSYHETKLFGVYFNHVLCMSIFILKIQ